MNIHIYKYIQVIYIYIGYINIYIYTSIYILVVAIENDRFANRVAELLGVRPSECLPHRMSSLTRICSLTGGGVVWV